MGRQGLRGRDRPRAAAFARRAEAPAAVERRGRRVRGPEREDRGQGGPRDGRQRVSLPGRLRGHAARRRRDDGSAGRRVESGARRVAGRADLSRRAALLAGRSDVAATARALSEEAVFRRRSLGVRRAAETFRRSGRPRRTEAGRRPSSPETIASTPAALPSAGTRRATAAAATRAATSARRRPSPARRSRARRRPRGRGRSWSASSRRRYEAVRAERRAKSGARRASRPPPRRRDTRKRRGTRTGS